MKIFRYIPRLKPFRTFDIFGVAELKERLDEILGLLKNGKIVKIKWCANNNPPLDLFGKANKTHWDNFQKIVMIVPHRKIIAPK